MQDRQGVCCANCGYLAVKHRRSGELQAADIMVRDKGYLLTEDPGTGQRAYEEYPVCFLQQIVFREKIARPTEAEIKDGLQVLKCDEFTEWHSGRSPKDHLEMKLLAEAESRNERWRREEMDRAQAWRDADDQWKKQVEALAETRHQELRRDAKKDSRDNRTFTRKVTAIGAVASLATAIVAAIVTARLSAPPSQPPQALTTSSAAPSLPQTDRQTTKASP